ncbi:DNA replication protein DnaD [Pueribacillus theae]|uniref:DNA replication protein DnaD n=1 Tax=Pueribacillus theae TaxID=2171751 RepID=A0A2U1K596_9BACI|nr:DnaD domain-containing protein [Pueribacillus theae]PWA12339.1 DNA replication protein DnaD [Pueribacillus theae]
MKREHLQKWLNEGSTSIPNLLLKKYKHIGIDEAECMLLIQIHSFIERGNRFPTPEELSKRMTFSDEACMHLIKQLINKGLLKIEEHKDTVKQFYSESYSLVPLWEALVLKTLQMEDTVEKLQNEESTYTLFEQEFGRPLSPIECETLTLWIDEDNHSAALIKAALKEAVLSGKLSFRYIDRILFEWKKNGIKTVEEAHKYGEKFRRHSLSKPQSQETDKNKKVTYPFYNWL